MRTVATTTITTPTTTPTTSTTITTTTTTTTKPFACTDQSRVAKFAAVAQRNMWLLRL